MTVSRDALQPVPTCQACRSSKTVRIEADGSKEAMLFCGACGHMWSAEQPPPPMRQRSIFETDPDPSES